MKAMVRYFNVRQEVIAAYGGKCACCGECGTDFLTLDHIHNDGHMEDKAVRKRLYDHVKQLGFPKDRFQLLCYNCNFSKGRRGVCQHQVTDAA